MILRSGPVEPGSRAVRTAGADRWARAVTLLAATMVLAGCSESASPVPGELRLGVRGESFRMPSVRGESVPFRYPARAWRDGVGGEVRLRIHITREGTVDSAYVIRSAGHPALDSAALADAGRLRYRPARRGDEPVDVWAVLPVRYPLPEQTSPRSSEEP